MLIIQDLGDTTFPELARSLRVSRFERAALLVADDRSLTMERALARVDRFDDEGC